MTRSDCSRPNRARAQTWRAWWVAGRGRVLLHVRHLLFSTLCTVSLSVRVVATSKFGRLPRSAHAHGPFAPSLHVHVCTLVRPRRCYRRVVDGLWSCGGCRWERPRYCCVEGKCQGVGRFVRMADNRRRAMAPTRAHQCFGVTCGPHGRTLGFVAPTRGWNARSNLVRFPSRRWSRHQRSFVITATTSPSAHAGRSRLSVGPPSRPGLARV